jgi:hypothetical protein
MYLILNQRSYPISLRQSIGNSEVPFVYKTQFTEYSKETLETVDICQCISTRPEAC